MVKVVVVGKDREFKKFSSLEEAEKYLQKARKLQEKIPSIKMGLVYNKPYIPVKVHINGGKWWCPFCREYRVFKYDKKLKVKRCSYCGISENSYYVKKANGLWGA